MLQAHQRDHEIKLENRQSSMMPQGKWGGLWQLELHTTSGDPGGISRYPETQPGDPGSHGRFNERKAGARVGMAHDDTAPACKESVNQIQQHQDDDVSLGCHHGEFKKPSNC